MDLPYPEISAIDKREPGLHATDKTIAVGVEGLDRWHMLVCGGHGFLVKACLGVQC